MLKLGFVLTYDDILSKFIRFENSIIKHSTIDR